MFRLSFLLCMPLLVVGNAKIYRFTDLVQVAIASIWVASVVLSIPQLVAFKVSVVDAVVPQCLPQGINVQLFVW